MNSASNEADGGTMSQNSTRPAAKEDGGIMRERSIPRARNSGPPPNEPMMQNSATRTAPNEELAMVSQNGIPRSNDPGIGGIDHSSAEAYDHKAHYMWGFTDLAAAFNWGVIVLTLGSYGLLMSTPVFWLCWSILVTEAVIFYSLRPYLLWIENAKRTAEDPKVPRQISDHVRAGAAFLKVGMAIALIVMIFYNHDFDERQNKILLFVGFLIILFEGFKPFALVRKEFRDLMRSSSDNHKSMQRARSLQRVRSITEGHDCNAINFLTPSVINAMIGVTGAIVLGGNLGSIMADNAYWILASIFVVDLGAEAIHRFDYGKRSLFDQFPDKFPNRHYFAIVLRLVVEGCLCYFMAQEISQTSYFPSQMDVKACDAQCQKRSKNLLITMVALGGLQAATTCTSPLWSCVLLPQYVPYYIFVAIRTVFWLIGNFLLGFIRMMEAINKTICLGEQGDHGRAGAAIEQGDQQNHLMV